MSKPINPMAIGGFTVGALALLVIGLLIFGGGQLFNKDKARYVIFFDSSLNGLDVGAPVKMQGVKIGAVTEIALQLDPGTGKVFKPVVLEIERSRFLGPGGVPLPAGMTHERQLENRDKLVARGFRARLEMQSFLTGLLYVDLNIYAGKPVQFTGLDYHGLVEFPSIPTTVDEIRNTSEEMLKKLRELPLEKIVDDFAATLADIRSLVGSEDAKKTNAALARTLVEMEKTMGTLNRNLEPLIKETNKTIVSSNALVQDSRSMVQNVHQDVKPVLAAAEKTLNTATTALNKAQSAVGAVEGSLGPESTLNEALVALKDAARSIKELTDYLQRHPESVISGKDH